MEEKKTKLIFKASIARKLAKKGHYIVDIKPNRENPVASVFCFDNTEKFREDLAAILDEAKKEEVQE